MIRREYYQEYACQFDLIYYPFDTQVIAVWQTAENEPGQKNIELDIFSILAQMCKMVFEVQGKTDNYVRLVRDGKGIEFLGKLLK